MANPVLEVLTKSTGNISKIIKKPTCRSFSPKFRNSIFSPNMKATSDIMDSFKESSFWEFCGSYVGKYHLEKSVMREVVALEQKMADMGVKVTFADNIETARIVTSAIEKIKASGLDVPERIILMTPKPEYSNCGGVAVKMFRWIALKKDLKIKNGFLNDILKTQGIMHNAVSAPEGIIFHEVGHLLQRNRPNASEIWKNMTKGIDMDLAKEVSYYAVKGDKLGCGNEFVAEVFAGLMSGKSYSSRVMAIYDALGGVKIPNL